jgi:hypothetical protein
MLAADIQMQSLSTGDICSGSLSQLLIFVQFAAQHPQTGHISKAGLDD